MKNLEFKEENCTAVSRLYNIHRSITSKQAYIIIENYLVDREKIKYGTTKNSCKKNELILLSEKKGYYCIGSRIVCCEIFKEEKCEILNEESTNYQSMILDLTLENIIIQKEALEIYKLIRNKESRINSSADYVFVDMNTEGFKIEVLFNQYKFGLNFKLPQNATWTNNKGSAEFTCDSKYKSESIKINGNFENFIDKYYYNFDYIDICLKNNVVKINNGYIYNNDYYKSLNEVIGLIEEKEGKMKND